MNKSKRRSLANAAAKQRRHQDQRFAQQVKRMRAKKEMQASRDRLIEKMTAAGELGAMLRGMGKA